MTKLRWFSVYISLVVRMTRVFQSQSKVKPMQSRITFDTRLKNDPYQYKKKKRLLDCLLNRKPQA